MAATGTSLAALKVGPSTTELREFDLPDIPSDAALLKVEIAGVCGTDVSQYKLPLRGAPLIMGHENVGYLAKVGRDFERLKGFKEGDLVFLEHYLPCGHCEWDHMGEYRHCAATEWFYDPTAIRYGYTAIDIKPSLWGGFSHYVYLPLNAVLHRVPKKLTPEEAGIATPMSNGVQWTIFDGGVGYGTSVLIQGPGQQGMCCAMAASQAGASPVIVTGRLPCGVCAVNDSFNALPSRVPLTSTGPIGLPSVRRSVPVSLLSSSASVTFPNSLRALAAASFLDIPPATNSSIFSSRCSRISSDRSP